jgi:hypothetical protein
LENARGVVMKKAIFVSLIISILLLLVILVGCVKSSQISIDSKISKGKITDIQLKNADGTDYTEAGDVSLVMMDMVHEPKPIGSMGSIVNGKLTLSLKGTINADNLFETPDKNIKYGLGSFLTPNGKISLVNSSDGRELYYVYATENYSEYSLKRGWNLISLNFDTLPSPVTSMSEIEWYFVPIYTNTN